MLKTSGLEFNYPGGSTLAFPDFTCAKGEHLLILGQSGSGKTTLLHLLAGLMRPKSGHIFLKDRDLSGLKGRALDVFRGQHIGIVFQRPHFVRALSVTENLLLAQRLAGLASDKARINTLLERLGISYKAQASVSSLSVGEEQRLSIARSIINKPDLILADEPTSALDDTNCERVVSLLTQEADREGATLVIVTHDGRLKEQFKQQLILEKILMD